MRLMVTLLCVSMLAGCASSSPRVDSPPQIGTALTGWGIFLGNGSHTFFEGSTSRGLCESVRAAELEAKPHLKPTPCVPVKISAD